MEAASLWMFWIATASLIYSYVGYAILVVLLGLARKRPMPKAGGELPHVSLIIPAHNEESVLAKKLENILALDYPPDRLEILVASDGSADRTVEIAERFMSQCMRVLAFSERRGKASVLNDAVREARGDVLCLCDANVMFRPDALRILAERLGDTSIGAVSGEVRLASDEANFGHGESLYYRLERIIQRSESRAGSLMGVDGGMYVIRRELYEPLQPDTILDDFVISMWVIRHGKKVVYEANAVANENGTATGREEFRRRVRVSAGAVQLLRRGPWPLRRPIELWQFLSHKLLRWLSPLLLVVVLASSFALWHVGPVYRAAVVSQLGLYLMAAIATVAIGFRRTPLGGVCYYFVMSHVAMSICIAKGLFNRQKVTWAKAARTALPEALEVRPR